MKSSCARDTAVLIPSYKPDHKLAPYVAALREAGFAKIVIVDDGSGSDFAPVFGSVSQDNQVTILHYEVNRGKGYALREGMRYLWESCPQCEYIITADSDGQHTVTDTLRMCDSLHQDVDGLWLGSRDFSKGNVPLKSLLGNRVTSAVFLLLYGCWVRDTQTGLRGFNRKLLPELMGIRGDRYEYEMNMLIVCAVKKIRFHALPIETVYENNNEGSHFRPLKDSARIYGAIFAGFFRFASVSLFSFVTDYGLFQLFKAYIPASEGVFRILFFSMVWRVLIATVLARLISGVLNFYLNGRFVFSAPGVMRKSLPKYLCVFFLIMLLSAGFTSSLHLWFGISEGAAKIPTDILLFLLSYRLQQRWVFAKTPKT